MHPPSIVYSRKFVSGHDLFPVLEEFLAEVGGLAGRIAPGEKILIKPNFVAPFKGATTDLGIIDFFITKIREAGAIPVIGESSGFEFDTEATFEILGVRKFAEERKVELLNFEEKDYTRVALDGTGTVEIANAALEARLIINLPILKGHDITRLTGAVKNLFGFLSRASRRHLHHHRLEKGIAALARRFRNTIHMVDARQALGSAVFSESLPLGYCLAGLDPFAIDHFGAKLLGINPDAVAYLKGVQTYTLVGDRPGEFSHLNNRSSLRERFHRIMYSTLYWFDEMKCAVLNGGSILPFMHWHFGMHPEIGDVNREELKQLSLLCPVGAIDGGKGRIIKERCFKVRCLKCYLESQPGKIVVKGRHLPKRGTLQDG